MDCRGAQARREPARAVSPRLLRAWRATDYAVATVVVRIGRRSTAMDALLARIGARTGVFVTAWNPLSRAMPEGWNRRMQRSLGEHLRRYVSLPADGSLRRWHEAHLLVAADPRPVVRLAQVFRQHGVVLVARHQVARLVLVAPPGGATGVAGATRARAMHPREARRWWGPQGRRDRRGDAAPPTGVARTHGGSAAAGRPAWPCDQGKFLRGRTGASVRGGGRSRYGK